MLRFNRKILFVGYGAVAHCTVPVLLKHIGVPPENITILDFEDRAAALKPFTDQGIRFVRDRITPDRLAAQLGTYLTRGDLLIDLAWNIDACELLQWCHDNGVLYINTSVEVWDPYTKTETKHPTERTLYRRHLNIRKMVAAWKEPGPTAIIEHGANPGLISHFLKHGLLDIAERCLEEKKITGDDADQLRDLVKNQTFNRLAQKLGVKVIHCSERDTQVTDQPKQPDEFVNTWSIEGLREEGTTTSEMGWGTHEKTLPRFAYEHAEGPKNQICLARMGINTWVATWVPNYCIHGMVIRHGEAFTISDRLTVWDKDKAVYRPTVHYAYCPCDSAIASLNELRGNDYVLQSNLRILRNEIIGGADILGALIMGHPFNSWWTGSNLSIEKSRSLVPHQNATTLQVAISVVSATMWMIENPTRGLCIPDDLPHEYILKLAKPYLGTFISTPSDWTPLAHYRNFFRDYNKPNIDLEDPWQFKNFLVTDGD